MLVIEYCHLGDLARVHVSESLSSKEKQCVTYQTLSALSYLHDTQAITHRDVKPGNILVKHRKPLLIKLCDFGIAVQGTTHVTPAGTNRYVAPEVRQAGRCSGHVDIWATGVIALEFTEGLPGDDCKKQDWHDTIQHRAKSQWNVCVRWQYVVRRMLRLEYQERPSAKECMKMLHKFNQVQQPRDPPGSQRKRSLSVGHDQATEHERPRLRTTHASRSIASSIQAQDRDGAASRGRSRLRARHPRGN